MTQGRPYTKADEDAIRAELAENHRQNERGEWMPDIPLPLFGLRKHCRCGRKFWTLAGYRGHYALVHILATP